MAYNIETFKHDSNLKQNMIEAPFLESDGDSLVMTSTAIVSIISVKRVHTGDVNDMNDFFLNNGYTPCQPSGEDGGCVLYCKIIGYRALSADDESGEDPDGDGE